MQQIESEEVVATPSMAVGDPPRTVCVLIQYVDKQQEHLFHEDFPVGFDLDGKFRARVGVALSDALAAEHQHEEA